MDTLNDAECDALIRKAIDETWPISLRQRTMFRAGYAAGQAHPQVSDSKPHAQRQGQEPDALVQRLREVAEQQDNDCVGYPGILWQAAARIAELTQERDELIHDNARYIDMNTRLLNNETL